MAFSEFFGLALFACALGVLGLIIAWARLDVSPARKQRDRDYCG